MEKIGAFVKQISKLKNELSRTKEAHQTDMLYWEEEMNLIKEQVGRFESKVGRSTYKPLVRSRQQRSRPPLIAVEENAILTKTASSQTYDECSGCKHMKTSVVALKEEKKIGEFLGSVSPSSNQISRKENEESEMYASRLSKYIEGS